MSIPHLIEKKRDGKVLDDGEIEEFVHSLTNGSIQDSQIGAMLMAMYLKGMTTPETVALTRAMTFSGHVFTFPEEWANLLVDKHSTGGVGDKISLVLAPALAACGLKVPMVSGRGLGFTGGTLDKLESIPGFRIYLDEDEMNSCLETAGCFIAGASKLLAPADSILYRHRDVTSTVGCLPLIVSSILSKKVAEGTKALVMDVKVGRGTFLKDIKSAKEISQLLVEISRSLGVMTKIVISRMDHPIGLTIGNAVEVEEAVLCLHGGGPDDVRELVETLGGVLLEAKGLVENLEAGKEKISSVIKSGQALERFLTMLTQQGVCSEIAEALCYGYQPDILPKSSFKTIIRTKKEGFVVDIDALNLGIVTWKLGAGRKIATEDVDHSVGLRLRVQVGQKVREGEAWIEVMHSTPILDETLRQELENGLKISESCPERVPLVVEII